MEYIFKLLGSKDDKLEKRGLQELCNLLENNFVIENKDKRKLLILISGLKNSRDVFVRRWLYKVIGLLKDRNYLPYLKGQLNRLEQDSENLTWITAAIFALTTKTQARKITESVDRIQSTQILLASSYFVPSLVPQKKEFFNEVISENDVLSLKWLGLIYGNAIPGNLNKKNNFKHIISSLNLHENTEVSEYSIWALYKSKNGTFRDCEISPQDIHSKESNIRRWLYRLITKDLDTIFVNYSFIEYSVQNESNVEAREGLAIGLSIHADVPEIKKMIFNWLINERNTLVRLQLIKGITKMKEIPAEFKRIIHSELSNPENEIVKTLLNTKIKVKEVIKNDKHKNKKMKKIQDMQFEVAFSFPGEKRKYIEEVVEELSKLIGKDNIFYDNNYKPLLAVPNLDLILQNIYHNQSKLIVVALCDNYEKKEWCGVEWRAVRDLIKQKKDQIMFLRFDNASVTGVFSIDGYLDVSNQSPVDTAKEINVKLSSM